MSNDPNLQEFQFSIQLEHQPSFIKAGLQYSSYFANVRSQTFPLKFTVSEILKFNGNLLYKSGEYLQASEEYEKALSIFRYISKKPRIFKKVTEEELEYLDDNGGSNAEKTKIIAHKLGLYLNLSLCYLIMGRWFNALRASQEVLKLEPYNTKALYRSAKAKIMNKDSSYHELVSAKNELELALKQQPNDQLIKQELAKIIEEINKNEEGFPKEKPKSRENPFEKKVIEKKKEFIPKDIQDLDIFLKTKGQDIVKLYEIVGKHKEADEFKQEMKAAMEAKNQIEKIGRIDFESQNEFIKEMADKYKIELSNPGLKNELLRIQNHNLKELRHWMDSLREIDTEAILSKTMQNHPEKIMEIPSNASKTENTNPANGNNYFINNNFYSPLTNSNNQYINNFGPMSEEKLMKWIECQKCKNKKGTKEDDDEEGEISGVISCLNCSLWAFSFLFLILTLVCQFFS